jgi:hypothetical protein
VVGHDVPLPVERRSETSGSEQALDEHAVLPLAVEAAVAPLHAHLEEAGCAARLASLEANTRLVSL